MTELIDWKMPFQLASDIILGTVGWIVVLLLCYVIIGFALIITKAFLQMLMNIFSKDKKKETTLKVVK